MADTEPCLHCAIIDLVDSFMVNRHLSVNEAAFKQVEALAALIAGIGSREGRRQMIRSVEEKLRQMVAEQVKQRAEAGMPPYNEVRMQ